MPIVTLPMARTKCAPGDGTRKVCAPGRPCPPPASASDGTRLAVQAVMTSNSTLVRDLMSADPVTLGRNDKLSAAEDLMRLGRIRHLPVLDEDGGLAGIVSQRDLFHSGLMKAMGYGSHAQQHALATVAIKEAMTTEVITTTPKTPIVDAARLMLEHKIGCLVVLESQKVVGILAESDFVKLAIPLAAALDGPVVLAPNVARVSP